MSDTITLDDLRHERNIAIEHALHAQLESAQLREDLEVALGMVDHADENTAALVDALRRERSRKLWWATVAIIAVTDLVGVGIALAVEHA